jgi:hypothetical protein
MNIRTSLLALALVSAACFAPTAFADPNDADQPTTQPTTQPAPEPEEHQGLRQDAHEVGQDVRHDAHEVAAATREEALEIHQSMHRTAHWRRYHVCKRYWHGHCTRWARRYPH